MAPLASTLPPWRRTLGPFNPGRKLAGVARLTLDGTGGLTAGTWGVRGLAHAGGVESVRPIGGRAIPAIESAQVGVPRVVTSGGYMAWRYHRARSTFCVSTWYSTTFSLGHTAHVAPSRLQS